MEDRKNVVEMSMYKTVEYFWGSAVFDKKGECIRAFLKPDAQEINLEDIDVEIHDNGIEFI